MSAVVGLSTARAVVAVGVMVCGLVAWALRLVRWCRRVCDVGVFVGPGQL